MTNEELFRKVFGISCKELWSMSCTDFVKWSDEHYKALEGFCIIRPERYVDTEKHTKVD